MQTIRSILASLAHTPLKSSITLATVGLGVGVLIFALSISSAFSRLISANLERDGRVVMVANAWWDADGALQYGKPLQFDRQVIGALLHGVSGARAASPVMQTSWTDFQAAGVTYPVPERAGRRRIIPRRDEPRARPRVTDHRGDDDDRGTPGAGQRHAGRTAVRIAGGSARPDHPGAAARDIDSGRGGDPQLGTRHAAGPSLAVVHRARRVRRPRRVAAPCLRHRRHAGYRDRCVARQSGGLHGTDS